MASNELRADLEKVLFEKQWTLVKLAEKTGTSRSVFSNMLRSKKPIAIPFKQLLKITSALNHPEDHFFTLYIDECFFDGKSHKSRIRPFLIRCAELGRTDCIEKVLKRMEEEKDERNLELIFEIIEHLAQNEKEMEVTALCDWFVQFEKDQHSEKMAIVKYRALIASISNDEKQNFEALLNFAPYRHHLPNTLKLQAIYTLINMNHTLSRSNQNLDLTNEQIELCLQLFGTKENPKKERLADEYLLKRPPVAYYGQSYVMKQDCLFELGEYEEGLRYSKDYADLSWFPNLDEKGRFEVEKFKMFAAANEFNFRLMLGQHDLLDELAEFLKKHPREVLPCLLTVLDAANQHDLLIDDFLNEFNFDLQEYINIEKNTYTIQASNHRYVLFLQKLSVYHYNQGRFEESLQAVLQSWELSNQTNNHSHLRMFASLAVMYNTPPEEKVDS